MLNVDDGKHEIQGMENASRVECRVESFGAIVGK